MSPRLDGAREASLSRWLAFTPFILQKSRMRRRARTDLCGGRSAMGVPTATITGSRVEMSVLPTNRPQQTVRNSVDERVVLKSAVETRPARIADPGLLLKSYRSN